jgi:2-oxo-3-hexenedioate decarboxylase
MPVTDAPAKARALCDDLRSDDVVLWGGLAAAVAVASGDVVVASVDRLGTLQLACR